jgi:hypothetical protein
MRRRALLLALAVAGLAAAGAAGLGGGVARWHDAPSTATALDRAALADAPASTALPRVRDALARNHDHRGDVPTALAVTSVLALAGGWWLARDRAARVRPTTVHAIRRTRAPPRLPAIVQS